MIKTVIWFVVLTFLGAAIFLVATNFNSILSAFVGLPLDYVGIFLLGAAFAFIAMWLTNRKNGGDE